MSVHDPAPWLRTRGPMSDAVRRHDWTATPLGPIGAWPSALRIAVANALGTGQPCYVAWGPSLVSIFNDAYVPILGAKADGALGTPFPELWSEVWEDVRPLVDAALSGAGTWTEDLPLVVRRHGYDETAYFTFSYAPLFDEAGATVGMVASLIETTRRVHTETALRASASRRAFRLALGEALREVDDPVRVQAEAARVLGEHLGVDRVAYGEVSRDGTHVEIARNHLAPCAAPVRGRFRIAEFGEGLVGQLRRGRPIAIDDAAASPEVGPSGGRAFAALGVVAVVNVPLVKSGQLVAVLMVHDGRPRPWTELELTLIEETAERTWAAVERARADAERRRAEVRRTQAMAAARLGSWEADMATGRTTWDERTAELVGVPVDAREDHAGRWLEFVHPDDREACVVLYERLMRDGVDLDAEYRVRTFDGRDRWFRSMGTIVRDADGDRARVVGVVQDVTDRKIAEQVLRDSEARFRTMADGIPISVWVLDAQGDIEFVNRAYAEYFGVSEAQVRGANWQGLLHPDDRMPFGAALEGATRERRDFEARLRVRRADGAWRWVDAYGRARVDAAGAFAGFAGTSIDVTAAVEAERALREADRMKDEYLMTLAHELRGPLAPIRTALALFARERLTETGDRALAMTRRQLHQLTRLVDDLLEASRAMRGMIEIRREPLRVQQVVLAAAETVDPLLRERGQPVAFELPPEPVVLEADPVRLAQVVENLLTNASKYSDPGSPIGVRVGTEGDAVLVEVRDRGVGIAPENLARLFQPFSQLDTTIDRARGGLGLGLSLVRRLVELHGGSVVAESEGPGHGSTFRVRLPRGAPGAH